MQTRALRTLVHISKVGSFAKAAEERNMTLSALSMQMKSIEAELGASLFDRSVRPPKLTPIGHSVVREATALLRSEDRMMALSETAEPLVGRFKIGFVTTAAVRLLPGFLKNAETDAPLANFEFETGLSRVLQQRVATGSLDAAIVTTADGIPEMLRQQLLREEPFVFAAHKSLLARGLDGLISQHRFFHFMPDTGIGTLIAEEMAGYDRITSGKTVVLDNLESIMECVCEGLGFTLLPVPDVTRYQKDDVEIIETPKQRKRTLVLVTARDARLPEQERALFDLLKSR